MLTFRIKYMIKIVFQTYDQLWPVVYYFPKCLLLCVACHCRAQHHHCHILLSSTTLAWGAALLWSLKRGTQVSVKGGATGNYTRIMAGGGGRARTASGKVEQTITQLLAHKGFHPKQRLDTG